MRLWIISPEPGFVHITWFGLVGVWSGEAKKGSRCVKSMGCMEVGDEFSIKEK